MGGGSSPLARGLLTRFLNATAEKRIIPARAGFTRGADASGEQVEDHPRSRGVYFNGLAERVSVEGSSPLARGLRVPVPLPEHPLWIIPARAGFTTRRYQRASRSRDHPRSRGVYPLISTTALTVGGSSPLARGLQFRARHQCGVRRIIPARAGFTVQHRHEVGIA